jgi:hypothetical protein
MDSSDDDEEAKKKLLNDVKKTNEQRRLQLGIAGDGCEKVKSRRVSVGPGLYFENVSTQRHSV